MNDTPKTDELLNREIRSIHLFAGAGGGILGDMLLNHRPIAAVEIDQYCRRVLNRRQKEGHLPFFPIFKNVKEFEGRPWNGLVDVVAGGFPCQPFSTAGKGKGNEDERNMWPDTIRIIREVGPSIAFLENVPGLLSFDYFGQIIGDLAESGFDAEWDVISAASLGAPHQRDRLWIFTYSNKLRRVNGIGNERKHKNNMVEIRKAEKNQQSGDIGVCGVVPVCSNENVADSTENRQRFLSNDRRISKEERGLSKIEQRKHDDNSTNFGNGSDITKWWDVEPKLGRVADVVASRVERLKAIGNGQVPCVAAFAMLMLAERAGIDLSQLWRFRNNKSDND